MARITAVLACLFLVAAMAHAQLAAPRPLPSTAPFELPPLPPPWKVDSGKLRSLAYLPACPSEFALGNISAFGLDSKKLGQCESADRIAALEKALTGDSNDAERYLELANLYSDDRQANQTMSKARDLFKKRIEAEPTDGWVLAQFATTLCKNPSQAAPVARKAAELAPGDWRCWKTLSLVTYYELLATMIGSEEQVPWDRVGCMSDVIAAIVDLPNQKQIEQAESGFAKALEYADKAVAAAPDDEGPYRWRLVIKSAAFCWRQWFDSVTNTRSFDFPQEMARLDFLSDAKILARLRPKDPEVLGILAGIYWFSPMAAHDYLADMATTATAKDLMGILAKMRDALPPDVTKKLLEVMGQLEELTANKEPVVAEAACRCLGMSLLMMGNVCRADQVAQQAIALNPLCQENWDLLAACKFATDQCEKEQALELYAVCKKQVDALPKASNFVQLARACANLNWLDEAEAVLRSALQKYSKDPGCRLAMAAVLLLKGDNTSSLAGVNAYLDDVRHDVLESNDSDLIQNLYFNYAIYLGATGHADESHRWLEKLRDADGEFQRAKDALALFSN